MADDLIGPYVSKFLLLDVPYGSQVIAARIQTLLPQDFLTTKEDWLDAQNGRDFPQPNGDSTQRYIRNGRDLGQFVHVDRDFSAFINAAKLLLAGRSPRRGEVIGGLGIDSADGIPYNNSEVLPGDANFNPTGPLPGYKKSGNQIGVATFGDRHVLELLLEVMNRGLRAAWYQKWSVHRRLRPEEFGGRIHFHLHPDASKRRTYEFSPTFFPKLQAGVLPRILSLFVWSLLSAEHKLSESRLSQPTLYLGRGKGDADRSSMSPTAGQLRRSLSDAEHPVADEDEDEPGDETARGDDFAEDGEPRQFMTLPQK